MRVREPNIIANSLSVHLENLASCLTGLVQTRSSEEDKLDLTSAGDRCRSLSAGLKQWLGQDLPGQVYWIESTGERTPRLTLASAAIEVVQLSKKSCTIAFQRSF